MVEKYTSKYAKSWKKNKWVLTKMDNKKVFNKC